jgi:hypothetical protein
MENSIVFKYLVQKIPRLTKPGFTFLLALLGSWAIGILVTFHYLIVALLYAANLNNLLIGLLACVYTYLYNQKLINF